jgi:hypothetical protein
MYEVNSIVLVVPGAKVVKLKRSTVDVGGDGGDSTGGERVFEREDLES